MIRVMAKIRHQRAGFYREIGGAGLTPSPEGTIAGYTQLQGKALSYNNIADTDAALECASALVEPARVSGNTRTHAG